MNARVAIAAGLALTLALTLFSIASAASNDYPVGRASLFQTNSSGVSGEAILRRQLSAGTTQVMVRAENIATTSAPIWKIETGSYCGTPPTGTLITEPASPPVTSVNTFMTSETFTTTLSVTSGSSMMTVRVYGIRPGFIKLTELACGQVFDQPALQIGGSQHWW